MTSHDDWKLLAAGHETGWWNTDGIPAPWPDDLDEWNPETHEPLTPEPDQPLF